MKEILVTGGTGVLGRQVVRRLTGKAVVRVLSRGGGEMAGARVLRGDLRTGEGLREAVDGVDVIVHAASTGFGFRGRHRDVRATRRLLAAIEGRPHLVFISIVGVETVPYGYHRAKLAVEKMIEESGLPWTILRTTHFHELLVTLLSLLARAPVAFVPRGVRVQPVDSGEVADRLVELALAAPSGHVPDLGGPRVHRVEDLMWIYLTAVRRRRPVVRLPLPGRTMAAYRAGHHLAPENATGTRGFTEALLGRLTATGTLRPPYDLGGR